MHLKYTELKVGDCVLFDGAEFEITSTRIFPHWNGTAYVDTMSANGKWLNGRIQQHYFGPGVDWVFQGNASRTIEANSLHFEPEQKPVDIRVLQRSIGKLLGLK